MPDSHVDVRDCFCILVAPCGCGAAQIIRSAISNLHLLALFLTPSSMLVQAAFPTGLSKKHDSLDALTLTVTTFVTCA